MGKNLGRGRDVSLDYHGASTSPALRLVGQWWLIYERLLGSTASFSFKERSPEQANLFPTPGLDSGHSVIYYYYYYYYYHYFVSKKRRTSVSESLNILLGSPSRYFRFFRAS